jgi:hypothetical protein
MLTVTLTRILIVLSLTFTLRGSASGPIATTTSAASAGQQAARPSRAARFVDDVEGCREQPVSEPIASAACE